MRQGLGHALACWKPGGGPGTLPRAGPELAAAAHGPSRLKAAISERSSVLSIPSLSLGLTAAPHWGWASCSVGIDVLTLGSMSTHV